MSIVILWLCCIMEGENIHAYRSFFDSTVLGLSQIFLLFQYGKKSLQCDLTVLGSLLSAGMI